MLRSRDPPNLKKGLISMFAGSERGKTDAKPKGGCMPSLGGYTSIPGGGGGRCMPSQKGCFPSSALT